MVEFKEITAGVGKTTILKDISVAFKEGEITTVVGPNGCGKTTLLQTLNGMSRVTKGSILLDGEEYLLMPERERAKHLSFLPQLREMVPMISVKGLVEHGRFPYMGFSRQMSQRDREAVNRAMQATQIYEYRNQPVNELSGGLRQRAYMAMQLAQDTAYMVLDEPMNFLDYPSQREMTELIQMLKKQGKTMILVLHDLNQALQLSDRLVVMENCRIAGEGTPGECLESGILRQVFDCEIDEVEAHGKRQYIIL